MAVAAVDPPLEHLRRLPVLEQPPRTRGDCAAGPRPCQWTECRYHLAPERRRGRSPSTDDTCSLDVADRGGATLEEVGQALGVTRERIRQVQIAALNELAAKLHRRGLISRAEATGALVAVREAFGTLGSKGFSE